MEKAAFLTVSFVFVIVGLTQIDFMRGKPREVSVEFESISELSDCEPISWQDRVTAINDPHLSVQILGHDQSFMIKNAVVIVRDRMNVPLRDLQPGDLVEIVTETDGGDEQVNMIRAISSDFANQLE